ncbi:MAG: GNAT family N-acetyltransferase, partial [Lautropia sp.]
MPGCLALSQSAHWNQNEADWRMMIEFGRGWGIEDTADDSRSLAASIVVIPFDGCAWVSMVLVLPQFRRRGFAGRLLRHALDWLHARGTLPILDATAAGYPVYEQAGFVPTWGFQRYRREAASRPPAAPATTAAHATTATPVADGRATCIRALAPADWPAILALDAAAFGGSRDPVLRRLADRLPAAARVAEEAGRVTGFILGRDGREACQLGPLVAANAGAAQALLNDALATIALPVYVDLVDRHEHLDGWLRQRGFAPQ